MNSPLNQTWNLDSIFPGGSESIEFAQFLEQLVEDIASFKSRLEQCQQEENKASSLEAPIDLMQIINNRIREAGSYVECLTAQNQADKKAVLLSGKIRDISAQYQSTLTQLDQILTEIPDRDWSFVLAKSEFQAIAFNLDERRHTAQEKMAPELEALAGDLSVDGYHGWGELYNTTVGRVKIPFEENGKVHELSAGQAFNKLHSSDGKVREQMFEKWEAAWSDQADFCADALNHLAGFRLQLYKGRKWDAILKEPLAINRMSEQTLQAMWKVINDSNEIMVSYLKRKAKLMGTEQLSWQDVEAPIGAVNKVYTYEEAAQLIVEQFRNFSPKMAQFAEMAFEKGWIEVEDRAGKRPGGFCTSFTVSEQTRIFMTFSGTASNVSTLAHELGHAYHQYVMDDLPAMAQDYAMNVAETASTFAEMIVSDAAVKQANNEQEKLALLEDKIQRSVAFFMNIQARFLFETRFYALRKQGLVGVEELNQLMEEAQKEAFQNSLSSYHPHFWASKLHFYITEVPFYNFPYTFGYLFSYGLYARALQEGEGFQERYIQLLRDTGSMTVETLAQKHLSVDLTEEDFWAEAVGLAIDDVQQFLDMTASM